MKKQLVALNALLLLAATAHAQRVAELPSVRLDSARVPVEVRTVLRKTVVGFSDLSWERVRLSADGQPEVSAYKASFWQDNATGFVLLADNRAVLAAQTHMTLAQVPAPARLALQKQAQKLERDFKRIDVEVVEVRLLAATTYEATFHIPAKEASSWTPYDKLAVDAQGRKAKPGSYELE